MSRLDRFLEFDAVSGCLTTEPGARFVDVLRAFLPRGFIPAVVPGTGFATLGGGLANDVHGKNHHQVGSFGQHLEWFDLRLADGDVRRVSPSTNADLFAASVGGLGLTGIIERLCIRLQRVPSNAVIVRKRRIRDLDEFLAAFAVERDRSAYVVGWIDALAAGRTLGRGVLETATPSPSSIQFTPRRTGRVPVDLPSFVLSPMTIKIFNTFYGRHVSRDGWEGVSAYEDFLFPLDAIHDWNKIYGKRGFRQFQCVLPFDRGRDALRKILDCISAANRGSFLAVLKSLGPAGLGHLSFAMPGYTLALDFPNDAGVIPFLTKLEGITNEFGGRIYLAKDSALSAHAFRRMYPGWTAFEQVLEQVDPLRRFRSDLAARLQLRSHDHG